MISNRNLYQFKKKRELLLFAFFILFFISCKNNSDASWVEKSEEVVSTYQFGICIDSLDVEKHTIQSGESLSVIFSRFGFSATESDKIWRSCAQVLDPKRIVAGKHYYSFTSQDSLASVHYMVFEHSPTNFSVINLSNKDSICAYPFQKEVVYKQSYMEGVISSSLWNTIIDQGGNPLLVLNLSDIYAWQIDFFDIQQGDAFKVIYEVGFIDDTVSLNVGKIHGALFSHKGADYYAIPFEQDSVSEFFDLDGNSLRKAFLKAPLDYFRISSRFSNSRFHPVLKRYRAHHGVDYAAPTGTPVKSIGDGTVIAKGYQKGGGGNYLKVKHNATYTTVYMHLHGFAKGIKEGSRVKQGEVIAYVGSTGLSTGAHLDFRVYKNNTPIDPLKMESPPSLPVKEELRPAFDSIKEKVVLEIEQYSADFSQF